VSLVFSRWRRQWKGRWFWCIMLCFWRTGAVPLIRAPNEHVRARRGHIYVCLYLLPCRQKPLLWLSDVLVADGPNMSRVGKCFGN